MTLSAQQVQQLLEALNQFRLNYKKANRTVKSKREFFEKKLTKLMPIVKDLMQQLCKNKTAADFTQWHILQSALRRQNQATIVLKWKHWPLCMR